MQANGLTAIWNATTGELEEVASAAQVENYWRQADPAHTVYTLEEYAFVEADLMEGSAHEELLEAGWQVLQLGVADAEGADE